MKEKINPKHYEAKTDVIDFCFQNSIPFAEGNAIKYLVRWRKKNGLEDLRKAKEYIDRLIKEEELTETNTTPKK